jgi:hypothetical protein
MATSSVAVTPGTGKILATNSISEDAVTKEIARAILNSSNGTELSDSTGIKISTSQLSALQTTAAVIATGAQLVTLPTDVSVPAGGNVAHGATDSGNPVKIGAKAVNAEPTAVTAAQRANLITDLVGKLITLPYANPENFVSGAVTTPITDTTAVTLLAAPATGLRNYITQIVVSNAHATIGTNVVIKDGSTVLYTIPAAPAYGGAVLTFPVPLRQPTTATAITVANLTTSSSTTVSASGYKGA